LSTTDFYILKLTDEASLHILPVILTAN